MAELRDKLDTISLSVANSAEACRAFKGNEAGYAVWLERHAKNGHVLHRESATGRTAHMHTATCPRVGPEQDAAFMKSPKVGSPTKAAALAFALQKKWKVLVDCDQCLQGS